jgi:hypothetical protein
MHSSLYLGGASGNLYSAFYNPNTAGNNAGQLEGIGVIASLGVQAAAVLQFNMPESIPTGSLKLRLLAMANASSGIAYWKTKDCVTSAGASIAAQSLLSEADQSLNWASSGPDLLFENKQNLSAAPAANQILTVLITFALQGSSTTAFTLAQASIWQPSIVWE